MAFEFYVEKNSSDIYEELSMMDDDNSSEDEDERGTDRMQEMISKYGNY